MSTPRTRDRGQTPHQLNAMPRTDLLAHLLACLDVPRWAEAVADSRPFPDRTAVHDAAERAARPLSAEEIHRALAAHPRIGERVEGSGTSASFSRGEQGGVDAGDADLTRALHDGNAEYERRFGHVYLVCASGRSGTELLEILHARLDNDHDTELAVVADELRAIATLRLDKVIAA
ncbi:2-oxo-4-hydroxy-4-carboxy-5-ureidoimidazoline decarboxylase [Allosaccharopolyspora coralli]|uniref:2-oxo-4-hydroxy-4-carboxy-5-ureidoimidazoline decarboxylase n=1 Tax=Allosaccharopolyspora coralli TaxID=2665642 RepID=A0A5Q3Q8K1_9PSEU|nr:2-oxo-4-hydroxy-4-carboxy-5-ureidoimidazoline decarboxylase [Allosaccharopolyspora coralli]QGK70140.1 2-oxo-4-hydroxy-4-carboxy-5-ureidoimidazoline decarboxylase [Allosaccharopolyspora coralli]